MEGLIWVMLDFEGLFFLLLQSKITDPFCKTNSQWSAMDSESVKSDGPSILPHPRRPAI